MEGKERIKNPWIKGYKVAFTYPSSQLKFVKRLDSKLAKDLGRDNVFFADDPEFKARLSGTDLSRALSKIYQESDIVVAFFGKKHRSSQWFKLELNHVLRSLQQGCRVFLVREKGATIPKWLRFNLWNKAKFDDVDNLARQIEYEIGEEQVEDAAFA